MNVVFLAQDKILARDYTAEVAVRGHNGQVAKAELAEKVEAAGHRRVLGHLVAIPVDVRPQVQPVLQVRRFQLYAQLLVGLKLEGLEGDVFVADGGQQAQLSGGVLQDLVLERPLEEPVQDAPAHEPGEASGAREEHREAVVPSILQGVQNLPYGLNRFECNWIPRHHLPNLYHDKLLLRSLLQKRHVLQLYDVHVVDPLLRDAAQGISRPLCHHHCVEDRQRKGCVTRGLHQDHGKGNCDPGSAGQVCHRSNKCVDACVRNGVLAAVVVHPLSHQAAVGCASQQ
mmetsp:Transcript_88250/g.234359  ORF Transcript_88250/g.234359 Transcript_88250/m.234359 type:complete len:285 (-) Transcript_88250:622-1476(-)